MTLSNKNKKELKNALDSHFYTLHVLSIVKAEEKFERMAILRKIHVN